jgi:hypothetical protein
MAVAMAGASARDVEDTVEIHLRTVREAIPLPRITNAPSPGRP